MIVHCRLLAREAIPSTLVWRAFAAAFDAAEANAPALLVLEDLVRLRTPNNAQATKFTQRNWKLSTDEYRSWDT